VCHRLTPVHCPLPPSTPYPLFLTKIPDHVRHCIASSLSIVLGLANMHTEYSLFHNELGLKTSGSSSTRSHLLPAPCILHPCHRQVLRRPDPCLDHILETARVSRTVIGPDPWWRAGPREIAHRASIGAVLVVFDWSGFSSPWAAVSIRGGSCRGGSFGMGGEERTVLRTVHSFLKCCLIMLALDSDNAC
jgi:hypothetical protein